MRLFLSKTYHIILLACLAILTGCATIPHTMPVKFGNESQLGCQQLMDYYNQAQAVKQKVRSFKPSFWHYINPITVIMLIDSSNPASSSADKRMSYLHSFMQRKRCPVNQNVGYAARNNQPTYQRNPYGYQQHSYPSPAYLNQQFKPAANNHMRNIDGLPLAMEFMGN